VTDNEGPPSATFYCAECGEAAAIVRLLVEYADDPRLKEPSPPGVPEGAGKIGEKSKRLSIEGGPAAATHGLFRQSVPQIIGALERSDAQALRNVDREFAPFYCRECAASYCRNHWETEDVWDDFSYDCTYGTCPKGHRAMIAD